MAVIKIIQTSQILKKKQKLSKNRKKAWKKQADLFIDGVIEGDTCITVGALGDKTADIFIDTGIGGETEANADENNVNGINTSTNDSAIIPLNYEIDAVTGLKKTDRPKSNKLIHAHRLLAGLPGGVKGPYKGVTRTRKVDKLEHRLLLKERSLQNPRNALKEEIKQRKAWDSLKKSRVRKKKHQKHSFDDNLWDDAPARAAAAAFTHDAIQHAKHVMKTAPINNRASKMQPTNLPAVPLPDPGLSYNPDLESHQKLLAKAVAKEVKRAKEAKKQHIARTVNFPEGALPVNMAVKMMDMNSEFKDAPSKLKTAALVKDEQDEDQSTRLVKKRERVTHQQRLRQQRHLRQLKEIKATKDLKKNENEVYRIKEYTRELDAVDAILKERVKSRTRRAIRTRNVPARHFREFDVEVSLGTELRGTLLNVQPSSNPLSNSINHVFRRGLLPSHCAARNYDQKTVFRSLTKRVSRKMQPVFTEEEMKINNEKTSIKK